MSPEEDRTRDSVDSEPKHYQLSYSGPHSGMKIRNFVNILFPYSRPESKAR